MNIDLNFQDGFFTVDKIYELFPKHTGNVHEAYMLILEEKKPWTVSKTTWNCFQYFLEILPPPIFPGDYWKCFQEVRETFHA
jgi:hypothetical protein